MADLTRLDDNEQRELCKLLEQEPVTIPMVEWTIEFMASTRPPERFSMYPPWWQGREWWDQLPRNKQLEYAARGCNK